MGMFDWIKFKTDCPTCGKEVSEFQSKDGPCNLEALDYWQVDNFYDSCRWCNTWIEYHRTEPKPYVPIEHYKQKFKPTDISEEQFHRNKEGKIVGYKGKD